MKEELVCPERIGSSTLEWAATGGWIYPEAGQPRGQESERGQGQQSTCQLAKAPGVQD